MYNTIISINMDIDYNTMCAVNAQGYLGKPHVYIKHLPYINKVDYHDISPYDQIKLLDIDDASRIRVHFELYKLTFKRGVYMTRMDSSLWSYSEHNQIRMTTFGHGHINGLKDVERTDELKAKVKSAMGFYEQYMPQPRIHTSTSSNGYKMMRSTRSWRTCMDILLQMCYTHGIDIGEGSGAVIESDAHLIKGITDATVGGFSDE